MKKGFTLTEMIAVIGIIALMSLLVVPKILNQVNNKKQDLSNAAKQMVYSAADLYLNENVSKFPKVIGTNYFVKLSSLVDLDYLDAPLLDPATGKEMDLGKCVKVTVDEYSQYNNYSISNCE